jgi:hypothetical protein
LGGVNCGLTRDNHDFTLCLVVEISEFG